MVQEETTQKTIAFVVKTTKLTTDVLEKVILLYLENQKQKEHQQKQGKMTVQKLVGQNVGVSNIEITENNIRSFERVAKKYRVDFAVKKDKTTQPPRYLVFFKGRDADVLTQAFKEFVHFNEKKKNRTRVSVKEKLKQFREVLSQKKEKERVKEQKRDRELSL